MITSNVFLREGEQTTCAPLEFCKEFQKVVPIFNHDRVQILNSD